MLKPLLLLIGLPLLCGAAGYGGGLLLSPRASAAAGAPLPSEVVETVPVGRVIVQIYKVRQITYLAIDLAVKVKGRARAIALAEPRETAALRDRVLTVLTGAAQTPLLHADKVDPERLAELLRSGLVQSFPSVQSVENPVRRHHRHPAQLGDGTPQNGSVAAEIDLAAGLNSPRGQAPRARPGRCADAGPGRRC